MPNPDINVTVTNSPEVRIAAPVEVHVVNAADMQTPTPLKVEVVSGSSALPPFIATGSKYTISMAGSGDPASGIYFVEAVYESGWIKVRGESSPDFRGYINLAQVRSLR